MEEGRELAELARRLIDSNNYLTLGTAGEDGTPWVSPVFYVAEGYTRFYWVSSPEARHSRNLAVRPRVSLVIFDSRAPVGAAQAVYVSAVAEELTGAEVDPAIARYSRSSLARGARAFGVEDVRPPALHRLYRATATEHSVLDALNHPQPGDRRTSVTL